MWITYGSFYFCRNNLGVALPGLQAEFGYTKAQRGAVLMSLKLAYASARNVMFGWATALEPLREADFPLPFHSPADTVCALSWL